MSQPDTIFLTLAVVLAAFMMAAIILRRRYPGQAFAAWMIASIATVAAGFVSAVVISDNRIEVLAVAGLFTAAAIFACQSIIVMTGQQRRLPATTAPALAFSCLTIAGEFAGIPFVYNTIGFHLGCALLLGEAGWRMFRFADGRLLDKAIAAGFMATAIAFALRGIGYSFFFDAATPFAVIETAPYSVFSVLTTALPCLALIFLMVLRMIDSTATRYRLASQTDSLTGLLNRNAFVEQLAVSEPGAFLILCDIDHFKRVNDTWGHAAGDNALQKLAGLFREINLVAARIGGEEFAILVRNATVEQARLASEGLRTAFSLQRIEGLPDDQRLTASFGFTAFGRNEDFDGVFKRADEALYEAKKAGRNKVVFAELSRFDGRRIVRPYVRMS